MPEATQRRASCDRPAYGPNETSSPPPSAILKAPALVPPGNSQMGLVGGQGTVVGSVASYDNQQETANVRRDARKDDQA